MRVFPRLVYAGVVVAGLPFAFAGSGQKQGTEIDGVWKLIKYVENGKPNEGEVQANYRVVYQDGVQEVTRDGTPVTRRKFVTDPGTTPKQIDLTEDNGTRIAGVYEVRGDELRVAVFADPEKRKTGRPGDLKEEGNIVTVYERVKNK